MSRVLFDTIRSGPTNISPIPPTTSVGATFPLTRLFKSNANGDFIYVQVIIAIFGGSITYSALVSLTVAITMSAGPAYTLGAVSVNELNISSGGSGGFGGGLYDSITLDQSGGNLRVVLNNTARAQNATCFASAARMGP